MLKFKCIEEDFNKKGSSRYFLRKNIRDNVEVVEEQEVATYIRIFDKKFKIEKLKYYENKGKYLLTSSMEYNKYNIYLDKNDEDTIYIEEKENNSIEEIDEEINKILLIFTIIRYYAKELDDFNNKMIGYDEKFTCKPSISEKKDRKFSKWKYFWKTGEYYKFERELIYFQLNIYNNAVEIKYKEEYALFNNFLVNANINDRHDELQKRFDIMNFKRKDNWKTFNIFVIIFPLALGYIGIIDNQAQTDTLTQIRDFVCSITPIDVFFALLFGVVYVFVITIVFSIIEKIVKGFCSIKNKICSL